jgi:PKD repeat protein
MKKNTLKFFFSILLIFGSAHHLQAQTISLITPANNFYTAGDAVFFSWNPVAMASHYELNIAEDAAFSVNNKTYKIFNAADTVLQINTSCKNHFWRLRAFSPLPSPYSVVRVLSIFTPACVPSLELWLDPSSGLITNGANEISEWKDRSGKNRNAVQTAVGIQGKKVTETAPTSNYASFVRLDGVDDFFNIDSSATLSSFFSVFSWRGIKQNFPGYNTVIMSKVSKPKGLLLLGSELTTKYYVDGAYNTFTPAELEINRVNTREMAPLEQLKMLNGITTGPPIPFDNFFIGKFPNDATSFWNGDIGDLIIYGNPLTPPEKQSVQKYLNDKYAPPVNLGADQTLCSFPYVIKAKKDYYTSYLWQDASSFDSLVVNGPGVYYVSSTDVFGTVSSDTVIINQDPKNFTVNLGADVCTDKPFTLYAGPSHLSYNWSTGATSNTLPIITSGTYWVTVTDCQGGMSTDTVIINIQPLPVFNLGTDHSICYYQKDTLDTGFPNSLNYTFLWSDNTTDSVLTVNKSGSYSVIVTDSKGCIYKDTIKIDVDSSLYAVSLGPDLALCSGNSIYLKTGAAAVTNYVWSDGSTNDSLKITASGLYAVKVSNAGNCSKSDTINVSITGTAPAADFTWINSCFGSKSVFTDASTAPFGETIGQWTWDFGDGNTSTDQHPDHLYADTGAFNVTLVVKTISGCESSIVKQVRVYPAPKADFSAGPLPCDNTTIQFNGSALGYGYAITQWIWNYGDGSPFVSAQSPTHHYAATGSYLVKLIVSNAMGCIGIDSGIVATQGMTGITQAILPGNGYSAAADSIVFSWSETCNAVYYELSIAEDSNFVINNNSYKVFNSADTLIKGFTLCKTYYWRVRAFAPVATAYANVRSFQVFSPNCLPGLELWLDASSGVVKDGSNAISQWNDKSNRNRNATQFLTAAQPVWYKETAATSNKSTFVRLDGTNDFMNIDSSATVGSFYSVFNWRGSLPNFSGYNTLLMAKVPQSKGFVLLAMPQETNYYIDGGNNTFTPAEVEVNGINTRSMAPLERLKIFSGITATPVKLPDFFIGKFPKDTNAFWNGDVGDMIIYSTALTALQKDQLQTYLNDKYAPGVNLGADQTVCGFPFTLHATKNYFTDYLWQNASTADSLVVNAPGTYYVKTTNVFGRVSADTIQIKVDALSYTVDLRKDTAVCEGQSVRLIAGPPYLSYKWSTGATTNMIDVNTSGIYKVEMKDCSGKISVDSMQLTVHPLPVFSFGKDTMLCNGNNFVLDPGFQNSKNLIFNWFDNTHDSVHIANYSGQFSLNVINDKGCSFADTIQVKIDSLTQLATLGADTSFCAGNSIYLKKGADKAVDYLWSTGSTNDSIVIALSGTYWVTVKSINNCSLSDTVTVSVAGIAPTVNFSASNACVDKLMSFTDLSTAAPGKTVVSWKWEFGDSFTSLLQHPTHTYADTGSYLVKLTVTTDDGCAAPFSKVIKVHAVPSPSFTVLNSCAQSSVQFSGTAITYGYAITGWSWNFGEPSSGANNTAAGKNATHRYALPGNYPVRLIVVNALGCADTITTIVSVQELPIADFVSSVPCRGAEVYFTDQSIFPSGAVMQSSFWSFGDNGTSILDNPTHIYSASVNYTVMHAITATNGCKDTVVKTITVFPSPTAVFSQSKICEDTVTTFRDISVVSSGSITNWKWFFGSDSSTVKDPGYVFINTGNAKVTLIVTTDKGCTDTLQKIIVVNPKPLASFTYTPTYGNPPVTINFTNTSTGNGLSYVWNFDDGGTSTLINPTYSYVDTGVYKPLLLVKNNLQCTDTASGIVTVLKRRMDVSIGDIVATLQNGFLNLTAQITNKGTADVVTMEVYISINGGATIRETWIGRLFKGATITNTFKTAVQMDNLDHFICISLVNPNGLADEHPADNERCEALNDADFEVLELYPNPSEGTAIIPVIVPQSKKLTITLYDARGQNIRLAYDAVVVQGLQLIELEMHDLNSGLYTCKFEYGDITLTRKIIKK